MRRQNQSCDYCRKSKKACDGHVINQNIPVRNDGDAVAAASASGSTSSEGSYNGAGSRLLPCSYCVRTKKKCSLNPYWGRSGFKSTESPSSSTTTTSSGGTGTNAAARARQRRKPLAKRHQTFEMTPDVVVPPEGFDMNMSRNTLNQLLENPALTDTSNPAFRDITDPSFLPNLEATADQMNFNHSAANFLSQFNPPPVVDGEHDNTAYVQELDAESGIDSLSNPPQAPVMSAETFSGLGGQYVPPQAYPVSQSSDMSVDPSFWGFPPMPVRSSHSGTVMSRPSASRSPDWRRRTSHMSPFDGTQPPISPSLFNPEYNMMSASNNQFITDSLLRIYHDVLENNLACWLAEENCPYKMRTLSISDTPGNTATSASSQNNPRSRSSHSSSPGAPQRRLSDSGSTWTNRIYSRVTQLDRVAQSARTIRLTRSESQAASQALNLSIMAFATQWAQGRRRTQRYHQPMVPDDGLFGEVSEEFERDFQQSIWKQAKRALQDVSELESYRVVYAELIFGLTERPWADHELPEPPIMTEDVDAQGNGPAAAAARSMPQIQDIMAQDGPPVVLERAARKIQALKFRFEAQETGFVGHGARVAGAARQNAAARIQEEDRKTIGLLYWLAVMFDTVSSPMSERPVALADEECEHDVVKEKQADEQTVEQPIGDTDSEKKATASATSASKTKKKSAGPQRWGLDVFVKEDQQMTTQTLQWPCAYDVATDAIAKSAPIKILIFRNVSYLQNTLRRKDFGQATEDAIRGAIMVYRYWNTTYGSFYRDLVRNYDTVPTRIRSWFVCIYIPWHLASLMLAEMIEFVDTNGLGQDEQAAARQGANMVARVKRSSAVELAELARITSPVDRQGDVAPPEQLPEYHFAVNEGPLMTEPWTVILVRAFTKASLYHLGVADDLRQHDWAVLGHESDELQETIRRADDCIRALWSLGKKSQMARKISGVLSRELHG